MNQSSLKKKKNKHPPFSPPPPQSLFFSIILELSIFNQSGKRKNNEIYILILSMSLSNVFFLSYTSQKVLKACKQHFLSVFPIIGNILPPPSHFFLFPYSLLLPLSFFGFDGFFFVMDIFGGIFLDTRNEQSYKRE